MNVIMNLLSNQWVLLGVIVFAILDVLWLVESILPEKFSGGWLHKKERLPLWFSLHLIVAAIALFVWDFSWQSTIAMFVIMCLVSDGIFKQYQKIKSQGGK